MDKAPMQFGGGVISPKVSEHLKRAKPHKKPTMVEFGGGVISPKVAAHIRAK